MSEIYKENIARERGFTLVEIIAVLGIIGLLLTVGIVSFRNFQAVAEVSQSAEDVSSILRESQSRSMAIIDGMSHGVHFDPTESTYTQFSGDVFIPNDPGNTEYTFATTIEFFNINLNGGGSDVVFNKLTGSTGHYGSIPIRSKTDVSIQRTILITNEGKISIQ